MEKNVRGTDLTKSKESQVKAPNQRWMLHEFVVASLWMGEIPYYIGYSSMYNYWGFAEQIPQKVIVLNTEKNRMRKIGKISFRTMKISSKFSS